MNSINRNDRQEVNEQTKRMYQRLHLLQGVKELARSKWKIIFPSMVILGFFIAWSKKGILIFSSDIPFITIYTKIVDVFIILFFVTIMLAVLSMIGTPFKTKIIRNQMYRIGLTNNVGETPELLSIYKENGKNKKSLVVYEFYNPGFDVQYWDSKLRELSSALNREVARAEFGNSRKQILVFTAPIEESLLNYKYWKSDYLSNENSVVVLGESIVEQVTVDFNLTPHLLFAGSTGSGKSKLLKLVLYQCDKKKNYEINIVDFKGGVDFSPKWHEKFNIIVDKESTLSLLTEIINILEIRKRLFLEVGVANIDECNAIPSESKYYLNRIIFACDEIAEMLDKSGLPKEEKELTDQISNKLAIIARTGRAFGCHLVLATQRPDANVLSGQIKNNTDFKACGKADNVLSQIVLDNTSAADSIPKNSQGMFITNTGVIFKAYLFDEEDI